jgi:hypothetical protein
MKKNDFLTKCRKLLILAFFFTFSAVMACEGQAIVGKWKFISTTMYFTPEGAADQGQASRINPVSSTADITSEFKSDHTYITITKMLNNQTITAIGGNWSLNGDQLTITVDPKYKPQPGVESSTLTISISGKTLIMSNHMMSNKMVSKMVTTAERIQGL